MATAAADSRRRRSSLDVDGEEAWSGSLLSSPAPRVQQNCHRPQPCRDRAEGHQTPCENSVAEFAADDALGGQDAAELDEHAQQHEEVFWR